jgi:hypothetical protein
MVHLAFRMLRSVVKFVVHLTRRDVNSHSRPPSALVSKLLLLSHLVTHACVKHHKHIYMYRGVQIIGHLRSDQKTITRVCAYFFWDLMHAKFDARGIHNIIHPK